MNKMHELMAELVSAPAYEWQHVPYTASRHKWRLRWYRSEDNGVCVMVTSPRGRRYSYYLDGGEIVDAGVESATSGTIASYWGVWGDSPTRLTAVLRITPKHVLDRLRLLLDASRELRELRDLFAKYAPADAVLIDYIKRADEYIVIYRDDASYRAPYAVHHLCSSGLHGSRYYRDGVHAWRDFVDASK